MLDLLPDLCDLYADDLVILPPVFRGFGGRVIFHGPVATVRCPEDNTLVRTLLSEPGEGRVLLVDGAGSTRCALLGDNLAALAVNNGWAGVVVYGYVRDVATLGTLDLGVQALGAMPLKSDKQGRGERGVKVSVEGRVIQPGDYLYADANGVLISRTPLALPGQSQ